MRRVPRGWRRRVFPGGISSFWALPELTGPKRSFLEVWRYDAAPAGYSVVIARAEPITNGGCSGWLWSATRFYRRGQYVAERGLSVSPSAALRRVMRGLRELQKDQVQCLACGRWINKADAVDVGPYVPGLQTARFRNFVRRFGRFPVFGPLEDQRPICRAHIESMNPMPDLGG